MSETIIDGDGLPIIVGSLVRVTDPAGTTWYGRVERITDLDGDVDDETGRSYMIAPEVVVTGTEPEPWEDSFTTTWTATGPWDEDRSPFQCDDLIRNDGRYTDDGGWATAVPVFRSLTPNEVLDFQRYAETHERPAADQFPFTHPVCRDVWTKAGAR